MGSQRQFIVDEYGRPSAVVLDIEEYQRLLERLGDTEDLAVLEQRRHEPDLAISSIDQLNELLAGD